MNIKQNLKRLVCCVFLTTTCAYADTTINLITNSDFDDSSVPSGSFQWETDNGFWAAAWLFNGVYSGVANSDPIWGGVAATSTVAFLVNNGVTQEGSVTQFISSEARDFTISFKLAQSPSNALGSVDVYFDNKRIAKGLTPPSDYTLATYNLTVQDAATTGVVHFISFRSVAYLGGVYLDDVVVTAEH